MKCVYFKKKLFIIAKKTTKNGKIKVTDFCKKYSIIQNVEASSKTTKNKKNQLLKYTVFFTKLSPIKCR
jgi:hypothetical protein